MVWVKRALIAVVALGVLGAVIYGFLPKPVGADVAKVVSGPLVVTVNDDGRTRVRDRYTLSAPVAGELQRIERKPGDDVKAGEVVARLLPAAPTLLDERTRPQLAARAKAAKAALNQAEERVKAADEAAKLAKAEFERQQKLKGTPGYSVEAADRAERQHGIAQADFKSAEFAVTVAREELAGAEAALAGGAADAPLELKAPVSGRVLRLYEESTRTVPAGTPLLEIGDPGALEVVVDLLSSEAVKLPPDARVIIERWGGAETLSGRVRRIEPSGFTKISALGVEEQRVNVLIDLAEPAQAREALGDGFAVEARMVIWETSNTLKVPLGALFRHEDGWAVFVVRDGKAELRPVSAGRRNGQQAQVLTGLNEGETVILHPGDTIKHGVAVAPR